MGEGTAKPGYPLERLLGEDRPDPGRHRDGYLVVRHLEDAGISGNAACSPTGRHGVVGGAHQAACSE